MRTSVYADRRPDRSHRSGSARPNTSTLQVEAEVRLAKLEQVVLPQLARDLRHLERTWRSDGADAVTIHDGDVRYTVHPAGQERLQGILAEQFACYEEVRALRELVRALRAFEFGGSGACALLGAEVEDLVTDVPIAPPLRVAKLLDDPEVDYRRWLQQYREWVIVELADVSRPAGPTNDMLATELAALEHRLAPETHRPKVVRDVPRRGARR